MRPGFLGAVLVCGGLAAVLAGARAAGIEVGVQPSRSQEKPLPPAPLSALFEDAVAQGNFVPEIEPNNGTATATPLGGADVLAIATIFPSADENWWSIT